MTNWVVVQVMSGSSAPCQSAFRPQRGVLQGSAGSRAAAGAAPWAVEAAALRSRLSIAPIPRAYILVSAEA